MQSETVKFEKYSRMYFTYIYNVKVTHKRKLTNIWN